MEFRVLESVFQNDHWQSMQLLKEGHDKIYNRDQITLDLDTLMINTDNSLLLYDIQDIHGIQLFYVTVEEILQKVAQDMNTPPESE